ncbi:MAG: S46 family peptidase [Myxococcaceae bacterium]
MKRILIFAAIVAASAASADEGMWLLNNFPSDKVSAKYQFKPTQEWLDHVRLSSARLAGGCSGSFVSANGLVMTNHHCAHSCIEQLSTKQKDFVASGFFAKTEKDEVKCPEIEINQLTDITDVTDTLNKATAGKEGAEFNTILKAEMSKLEKSCATSDAVRCDVVTLYNGGKYHLYKYRRFQDVRLVFAPEFQIAFFGGDPDNFMFPRYDLDVSFLRVYDQGKPAKMDHFFKWSPNGAKDGELTFVSGHPGKTSRNSTIAELEYQRDIALPTRLFRLEELRGMLTEFQNRGPEQKRFSNATLFYVENSVKALKGRYEALTDKTFFATKVKDEQDLKAKVMANAQSKQQYGAAWDNMSKAVAQLKDIRKPLTFIEQGAGFQSELFTHARHLVRSAEELPKANETRLREYTDGQLPALKQELASTAPIYDEFEIATLTFSLTKLREELKADDPFVKRVFGKESPKDIATRLVKGSKLKDPKVRMALFTGGQKAVDASKDPMIEFAKLVDPDARAVRKKYEDEIESVMKKSSEQIAKARFDAYGTSIYPDATFTLRLSYGAVKGYPENGKQVNPITTIAGLYDRATGRDPFALPKSWIDSKTKVDMNTPMNFCSTNDIIGGNSGSPVFDRARQIVGLIFDGNIQSLGGDYGFDETVNRTVAVHSSALVEALDKVYGAGRIATELKGGASATTGSK